MRLPYALLIPTTIALGLASRRWPVFGFAPGDVLYATMAYWGFRWLTPRRPRWEAVAWAGGFCGAIEVSQLWRTPWLEAWRATRPGALVSGRGFLWEDLGWYAVGVALGWALDRYSRPFFLKTDDAPG
jgi:hypothetical protein